MTAHRRWSAHLYDWLEVVCSSWKSGTYIQPHDHGKAKGIVLLLWGELRERRWQDQNGQLVYVDELVMRAPAIGRVDATDIHDVYATKSSLAAHLYFPKPDGVRLFPSQKVKD